MKKEWIDVRLTPVYIEDLVGTVNETITYLSDLVTDKYLGFRNYRLQTADSWSDGSLELVAERQETNKEYSKRKKRAIAASKAIGTKKAKKIIKDKKTLARLQKKYGKIE